MPSLFRFIGFIAIVAAIIYGGMFAIAHFYDPTPREITVSIPPERLKQK